MYQYTEEQFTKRTIYFNDGRQSDQVRKQVQKMKDWGVSNLSISILFPNTASNLRQQVLNDISHICFSNLLTLSLAGNNIISIEILSHIFLPSLSYLNLGIITIIRSITKSEALTAFVWAIGQSFQNSPFVFCLFYSDQNPILQIRSMISEGHFPQLIWIAMDKEIYDSQMADTTPVLKSQTKNLSFISKLFEELQVFSVADFIFKVDAKSLSPINGTTSSFNIFDFLSQIFCR